MSSLNNGQYLKRLASFRSLPQNAWAAYCTTLARRGFSYSGRDMVIECDSCKIRIQIDADEFQWSHVRGCPYENESDISEVLSISSVQLEDAQGDVGLAGNQAGSKTGNEVGNGEKNPEAAYSEDTLKTPPSSNILEVQNALYTSSSSCSAFLTDFPILFDPEYLDLASNRNVFNSPLVARECDKNPGHFAYFNLPSLRLEQIPSKHRCTEMLVFLKVLGDLTVKLIVSQTSDLRRKTNHKMIHGTGFVIQRECQLNTFSQKEQKSKLKYLKTYFPFASKKDAGCVFIQTSRHLVANDEEARNTTVEFFYDSVERKNIVTLKGKYLLGNVIPGDSRCLLVCESSDLRFTERINHLQTEFTKAINNLPMKAKKGMLKKLFMIHHPHGGPKVLSYGDFVQVKYKTITSNGNTTLVKLKSQDQAEQDLSLYRKALFYAVDTCPGSCGAPFLTFCSTVEGNTSAGFTHDLWMHDGVEPTHKLGASVLKVCTADDFIPPRAEGGQPDEDSDDEGTLGKEQVNSSVYKVISTPSHPEYILFQSRLDSYRVWQYSEILNPQRLASCGFYYTGDKDCVRCFQCGLGLRSWKPGDDVLTQHEKYRPTCPYLQSSPKDVSTGAIADTSFIQSEENMELKLLESENTKLKQQMMCKVCFKSEIKDVFLPCGELYACSDCSKLLTHCPSCKKQILATVTVYLT